jgi:hypothetical protein
MPPNPVSPCCQAVAFTEKIAEGRSRHADSPPRQMPLQKAVATQHSQPVLFIEWRLRLSPCDESRAMSMCVMRSSRILAADTKVSVEQTVCRQREKSPTAHRLAMKTPARRQSTSPIQGQPANFERGMSICTIVVRHIDRREGSIQAEGPQG